MKINFDDVQDFLNMFFKDVYKPIPPAYNLVLALLWRHPENVDIDQVKVVHYCAAVCDNQNTSRLYIYIYIQKCSLSRLSGDIYKYLSDKITLHIL